MSNCRLFKTVSVYRENNLKAPPPVNGRYRLTLGENLPNCEKSDTLTLNIQQSGIYLNANASILRKSTLWQASSEIINLSGKVDRAILCNIPRPQNDPLNSVAIQMQLVDKGNMTGQLTVNGIPQL